MHALCIASLWLTTGLGWPGASSYPSEELSDMVASKPVVIFIFIIMHLLKHTRFLSPKHFMGAILSRCDLLVLIFYSLIAIPCFLSATNTTNTIEIVN